MMQFVFRMQRKKFEKQVEKQNEGFAPNYFIRIEKDSKYGEDPLQTFDALYCVDANITSDKLPVIINIHGGGLMMGDKDFNLRFNEKFCNYGYHGFVVFSVNYRLVPDVTAFEQVQDVLDALQEICRVINYDRKSKRPIYLVGDSAGAYLITYALAAMRNHDVAEAMGVDTYYGTDTYCINFNAVALISGMFFTNRLDNIGRFMPRYLYGKGYKDYKFYKYIDPTCDAVVDGLPPTVFVTSGEDTLRSYTFDMYEAVTKKGKQCKLLDYPSRKELGHAFSVFSPDLPESNMVVGSICRYFKENCDFTLVV